MFSYIIIWKNQIYLKIQIKIIKAVEKPTFVKSVQGETAWFSGALVFDLGLKKKIISRKQNKNNKKKLENDGTPEVIFCYYSIFVYRVKDLKDANSLERVLFFSKILFFRSVGKNNFEIKFFRFFFHNLDLEI